MDCFSFHDIIYSDACLVFIVTGLVCAVVRWFHMCRPYDREEKYFYPARRMVSFFYAAIAVLEIPYVCCPMSDGVLDYVRILGIVYYPVCFLLLFLRYFRWRRLETPLDWVAFILIMSVQVALLVVAVGDPAWLEANVKWAALIGGGISILLSIRLFGVLKWVYDRIEDYHRQNFSSDSDFPYKFAENVMWLPAVWILIEWCVFLADSRDVKMVSDIVLSVGMVGFLCMILHPQRILQPESVGEAVELLEEDEERKLEEAVGSAENGEELADGEECMFDEEARRQVLDIILRRYKEQHLQKKDVLAEVDKGKVAPASRYIASVGYYNLINMFRLEYARQYAAANPHEKQAAVAEASGFSSGSGFSKAKKSVRQIDPEIVSGVHL